VRVLGSASTASGIKVSSRILERYLLRGEEVVVATRHHWAKLVEPVLTVLVGFVLIAWLGGVLERSTGEPALWLWWMWFALVVRMGWMLLEWRNEWFVATDKRLLKTYGLITHKVAMMPLGKVTDMNYGRSLLGRFVGYGTFLMESAGQDQALREITWVPEPDTTYRAICDIIFGPGQPGRRFDSDDQLARDRGGFADLWGEETDDEPGWEVSPGDDSAYMPVRARPRRTAVDEDEDITGPLPPL
jgi:Bacterial PH domain